MNLELLDPPALLGSAAFAVLFWRRQQRLRGRGPGRQGLPLLLEYTMGVCMVLWILNQATQPTGVGMALRGGKDDRKQKGPAEPIQDDQRAKKEASPEQEEEQPVKKTPKESKKVYKVEHEGWQFNLTVEEIRRRMPSFEVRIHGKSEMVELAELKRLIYDENQRRRSFEFVNDEGRKVPLFEEIDDLMQLRSDIRSLVRDTAGIPRLDRMPNGRYRTIPKGNGRPREMSRAEGQRLQQRAKMLQDGLLVSKSGTECERMTPEELIREYYQNSIVASGLHSQVWVAVTSRAIDEMERRTPSIFLPDDNVWVTASHDLLDELSGKDPTSAGDRKKDPKVKPRKTSKGDKDAAEPGEQAGAERKLKDDPADSTPKAKKEDLPGKADEKAAPAAQDTGAASGPTPSAGSAAGAETKGRKEAADGKVEPTSKETEEPPKSPASADTTPEKKTEALPGKADGETKPAAHDAGVTSGSKPSAGSAAETKTKDQQKKPEEKAVQGTQKTGPTSDRRADSAAKAKPEGREDKAKGKVEPAPRDATATEQPPGSTGSAPGAQAKDLQQKAAGKAAPAAKDKVPASAPPPSTDPAAGATAKDKPKALDGNDARGVQKPGQKSSEVKKTMPLVVPIVEGPSKTGEKKSVQTAAKEKTEGVRPKSGSESQSKENVPVTKKTPEDDFLEQWKREAQEAEERLETEKARVEEDEEEDRKVTFRQLLLEGRVLPTREQANAGIGGRPRFRLEYAHEENFRHSRHQTHPKPEGGWKLVSLKPNRDDLYPWSRRHDEDNIKIGAYQKWLEELIPNTDRREQLKGMMIDLKLSLDAHPVIQAYLGVAHESGIEELTIFPPYVKNILELAGKYPEFGSNLDKKFGDVGDTISFGTARAIIGKSLPDFHPLNAIRLNCGQIGPHYFLISIDLCLNRQLNPAKCDLDKREVHPKGGKCPTTNIHTRKKVNQGS